MGGKAFGVCWGPVWVGMPATFAEAAHEAYNGWQMCRGVCEVREDDGEEDDGDTKKVFYHLASLAEL